MDRAVGMGGCRAVVRAYEGYAFFHSRIPCCQRRACPVHLRRSIEVLLLYRARHLGSASACVLCVHVDVTELGTHC